MILIRIDSVMLQPVSMIRQRILGVAGTFVVLSFLSHSSSKEYKCVILFIVGLDRLLVLKYAPPL